MQRIPAAQPAGFTRRCSPRLPLFAAVCWVQAAATGEHSSDPGSPPGAAPAVAGVAATSAGAAQPLASLASQQAQRQQHEHQLLQAHLQQQQQQQQQQQLEVRCPCIQAGRPCYARLDCAPHPAAAGNQPAAGTCCGMAMPPLPSCQAPMAGALCGH